LYRFFPYLTRGLINFLIDDKCSPFHFHLFSLSLPRLDDNFGLSTSIFPNPSCSRDGLFLFSQKGLYSMLSSSSPLILSFLPPLPGIVFFHCLANWIFAFFQLVLASKYPFRKGYPPRSFFGPLERPAHLPFVASTLPSIFANPYLCLLATVPSLFSFEFEPLSRVRRHPFICFFLS